MDNPEMIEFINSQEELCSLDLQNDSKMNNNIYISQESE